MSAYDTDMWLNKTINNLETTHPDYEFDCVKYWRVKNLINLFAYLGTIIMIYHCMKNVVKKFIKKVYKKGEISLDKFKEYADEISKKVEDHDTSDIRDHMCMYVTVKNNMIQLHKEKQNKKLKYKKLKKAVKKAVNVSKVAKSVSKSNPPKITAPFNVFLKKNFGKKMFKNYKDEEEISKKSSTKFSKKYKNNDKGNESDSESGSGSDSDNDENSCPTAAEVRKEMMTGRRLGPQGTQWCHDVQCDDELSPAEARRSRVYDHLASIEYPPQRSKKWFKQRRERITASDGGTVIGQNPYEEQYKFVVKKVLEPEFQHNKFCYHGKKLEEIATMSYEYRMNVNVTEFGLVVHPDIAELAASPDGIVSPHKLDEKHLTKYVGRMLEIKCPLSRKICKTGPETGPGKNVQCPQYYWVQVQLQLECCDLDECDFWQCNIDEYASREEFNRDSDPYRPFLSRTSRMEKGALVQILPKKFEKGDENMSYIDKVHKYAEFIYPTRIEMSAYDTDMWLNKTINNLETTHPDYEFDCVKYWRVKDTHNTTIKRDRKWFAKYLPTFIKVWSFVDYFRENKKHSRIVMNYIKSLPELKWFMKDKRAQRNKEIMEIYDIVCGKDKKMKKNLLEELKEKTSN